MWMTSVSTLVDRGREESVAFCALILHSESRVVRFSLCEHSKLQRLGQKLCRHWLHSRDKMDQAFRNYVDTDFIHVIKWTWPSPLRFCIPQAIKNWMVGRPRKEASKRAYQGLLYTCKAKPCMYVSIESVFVYSCTYCCLHTVSS